MKPYEISAQANHNKKNMFALLGRPGYRGYDQGIERAPLMARACAI
ncbi:hypothetical protein AC564_0394 [Lacticaseibacillus paracasei]|nr:hypothetical protein AC564_0394 [Lacticaseibacillus paracasei]